MTKNNNNNNNNNNRGSFSSTTTMSGKAAFITGYVDDDSQPANDELTMNYMYQLNMNSSFTGEDLLYTRIKTGNSTYGKGFANKTNGSYLGAANTNSDALKVDKLWYQFPVGDNVQVWVGPKIENYYMLASAPSIYKPVLKQFALGGNASTYGSSTSPGFGAAWTQQVDDPSEARFAVSANYAAKDGDNSTTGLFNDGDSKLFTKVELGNSQWQVSAASAYHKGTTDWGGYYNTNKAGTRSGDESSYALRGYWRPKVSGYMPEISFGYDVSNIDGATEAGAAEETAGWMVGLGWKDLFVDGNRAGVAFGSRQSATSVVSGGTDVEKDSGVWEAYYTFKVNDGVSITPAVFGGTDVDGTSGTDMNGGVVLTEFRF